MTCSIESRRSNPSPHPLYSTFYFVVQQAFRLFCLKCVLCFQRQPFRFYFSKTCSISSNSSISKTFSIIRIPFNITFSITFSRFSVCFRVLQVRLPTGRFSRRRQGSSGHKVCLTMSITINRIFSKCFRVF